MNIVLENIKSGYDFAERERIADRTAGAEFVIFIVAFVLEDIGQISAQEMYQFTSC